MNAVIRPDPSLLADLEKKEYNTFHVPEAVGSPYIPAQNDFVIPHGVQSVLDSAVCSRPEIFSR